MTRDECALSILACKHRSNIPHPNYPGKRLVGWTVDEDVAGLSDGLFALEEIEKRAALGGAGWQDISTAPKDGTSILAIVAPNRRGHLAHHAGRAFVIRHEGKTVSDYDLGWAVYPGFGGADDQDFASWQPIAVPAHTRHGRDTPEQEGSL